MFCATCGHSLQSPALTCVRCGRAPLERGLAAMRDADYQSASEHFLEALAEGEDKVAALLLLAHNYWLQADLSAATDWLQQVIILAPEQAYAHALLGSVLLARRQFAAARECLDVALSLAPDDMRVRISRAEYFYQSERYAETIGELGHALRLPAPSPAVRAYARDLLRAAQARKGLVCSPG